MPKAPVAMILSQTRRLGNLLTIMILMIAASTTDLRSEDLPKAGQLPEKKFMNEVTGEFDVKIVPVDTGDDKMGMMTLDKQYHGDLAATGKGRMLTGMTDVKGSAAYVAIERVKGKLKGAEGSFLVHHTGTMNKEAQSLVIRVVPDSGTGDLAGIDGEMSIKIADGKHFYRFEYTLDRKK